jgi:hypothetical protein
MRRPLPTLLAVLAMLTQVVLGVAAPLGLVFCVGETHAAVELAVDDCCPSHGSVVPTVESTIARACCSDILLSAATRPIAAGPSSGKDLLPALSGPTPSVPAPVAAAAPLVSAASLVSAPPSRPVVLRV